MTQIQNQLSKYEEKIYDKCTHRMTCTRRCLSRPCFLLKPLMKRS